MVNIKFDYVGCETARENLLVANNTWMSDVERLAVKHMAENGTEEQCANFKAEMEEKLTARANTSLAWY